MLTNKPKNRKNIVDELSIIKNKTIKSLSEESR